MTSDERPVERRVSRPPWPAFVGVAVAAAALAFATLRNATPAGVLEDTRGQRWRVFLAARPADVTAGAEVAITVTVRNVGEGLQSLTFRGARQIAVVVRDAGGRVVWRSTEPATSTSVSRAFPPGRVVRYGRSWSTSGAPPGEYRVEASVLAEELGARGRATRDVTVTRRGGG